MDSGDGQQNQSSVEGYDRYLKLFMWIRLFKIRFLGDDQREDTYLMLDSELDAVAEKIASQKNMESYLHRVHYNLRLEERKLRDQYNYLQTEEVNFEAAQSLQDNWGRGAFNAQRHPTLGEMQRLFFGLGFQIEPKVQEATQLRMLSKDFYNKTQTLMDECRSLMEQNDRTKSPYFNRKLVEKAQDSIKKSGL